MYTEWVSTETLPNRKITNYDDLRAHSNKQETPQQSAYTSEEDMDTTDSTNRNQNRRLIPETDRKLRSQTKDRSNLLT